ncbi:MAG: SPFH domain-containing protein [Planctomycetota bacterium]
MKTIKYFSIFVILAAFAALIIKSLVIIYIPAGQVGVRTQEYGILGSKGVVQEDFGPGWHRDFGPIDSWVTFNSTIQTLEMTRDPRRGSRQTRDDVQVQSSDGYKVNVDVTVKYRIQDGQAHKLYQDTGGGERYKVIVRTEAEKACIELFGKMRTEDFYNPAERQRVSRQAHKELQESLKDNYVDVVGLLIRDVQFDPDYEKRIQAKKLADQEVEVQKSMDAAEKMSGKTQVIEATTTQEVEVIKEEKTAKLKRMQAETDRKIARIRADYERYATEKNAEAERIAAEKRAEGTLLVNSAEAEGERLRNRAMMGTGGEILVALEAARNLRLGEVTLSSVDTDLLDVEAMARKLGAPPAK